VSARPPAAGVDHVKDSTTVRAKVRTAAGRRELPCQKPDRSLIFIRLARPLEIPMWPSDN